MSAAPSALVPSRSAALARASIAHHSKSFALASRLLGPTTRDHTSIVYAYCRHTDDLIDHAAPGERPAALARVRAELAEVYAGQPADPVLAAFAEVARACRIPRAYPEGLLDGMAMDVADTRYATLGELYAYCFRVASVVGLMMCHVFGVRDDAALVPAARLGIAMQLTNVCRDVAEDWARGRLYVPDQLLARHGAPGLAAALGGPLPASAVPALARAVRELLALADGHYRAADAGLPALPWRAALAVRAARSVYAAIGPRLARSGHDVTAGRAVVPSSVKLALVLRAAARTLITLPARALAPRVRPPARTLELADVPLA